MVSFIKAFDTVYVGVHSNDTAMEKAIQEYLIEVEIDECFHEGYNSCPSAVNLRVKSNEYFVKRTFDSRLLTELSDRCLWISSRASFAAVRVSTTMRGTAVVTGVSDDIWGMSCRTCCNNNVYLRLTQQPLQSETDIEWPLFLIVWTSFEVASAIGHAS